MEAIHPASAPKIIQRTIPTIHSPPFTILYLTYIFLVYPGRKNCPKIIKKTFLIQSLYPVIRTAFFDRHVFPKETGWDDRTGKQLIFCGNYLHIYWSSWGSKEAKDICV